MKFIITFLGQFAFQCVGLVVPADRVCEFEYADLRTAFRRAVSCTRAQLYYDRAFKGAR